jgi:carboxyl-terminal processing protease
LFNSFTLEYSDKNRKTIATGYKTFDDFKDRFSFSKEDIDSFIKEAEKSGVKYDEAQFSRSRDEILRILKGLVAANIWQSNEYYRIVNEDDVVIEKALRVISDKEQYNKLLGNK